jgi:hypothetical protein
MNINYKVDTNILENGDIEQITSMQALINDKAEIITRQLVHMRDAGVRDALIQLGWAPPEVASDIEHLRKRVADLEGGLRYAIKEADDWYDYGNGGKIKTAEMDSARKLVEW